MNDLAAVSLFSAKKHGIPTTSSFFLRQARIPEMERTRGRPERLVFIDNFRSVLPK